MRMRILLLAALCLVFRATPSQAAWTTNTMLNVPVCQAANSQSFASPNQQNMLADGSGGFYVVWVDQRFISGFGAQGYEIYGQHFNYLGNPLWSADGALLAGGTTDQTESSIVTDGAGGFILSWSDARTAPPDIYAQRFNASGAALWTAGGVPICVASAGQSLPMMVADGSGGAYIVWNDLRNNATTGQDLYMQRVNGSGGVQWGTDGTLLSNGPSSQIISSIAADPTGGFWAVWQDYRNVAGTGVDLYMNRVYSNGYMPAQPPSSALAMCTATGGQFDARVISDGLGGAYFTWADSRAAVTQVYGQRYNVSATAMWVADGAPLVSNLTSAFYTPSPRPISDGAGGLFLIYGTPVIGERAIHLLPTGSRLWGGAEINLYSSNSGYSDNALLADGRGGFEVVWPDGGQAIRIRAQRYDANGAPQWPAGGAPVCTAISGGQSSVTAVSDGAQGFFTGWGDTRNGLASDLFGGHVDRGGRFGGGEPSIASVRDIPNDQGGKLRLNFNASYLDQLGNNRIYYYNIYRQVPGALAQAAGPAGAYRATRFGAQTYFWESVATIYPKGFDGYSAVITTTGDSTGLGNPRTLYMVEATDVQSSFIVYDSQPDSGYSVDNLPPAAPAPLPSQYSTGLARLHWSRNHEADLAGYRLYRSTSPAFAANAANFVAAVADTGFADATSQPYYYELTAVDSHGNESPVAALTPQGVLGVGDGGGAVTLALALARPAPSPASSHTRIACTLPRAMRLELTLHDTAGRLVRHIAAEDAAAGTHTYEVSLRDGTGRALAPGIYLVRLAAGADVRTQRLVVLGD